MTSLDESFKEVIQGEDSVWRCNLASLLEPSYSKKNNSSMGNEDWAYPKFPREFGYTSWGKVSLGKHLSFYKLAPLWWSSCSKKKETGHKFLGSGAYRSTIGFPMSNDFVLPINPIQCVIDKFSFSRSPPIFWIFKNYKNRSNWRKSLVIKVSSSLHCWGRDYIHPQKKSSYSNSIMLTTADIYNIVHMINQPKRLQFLIVSNKQAQRNKCGIGLDPIIVQYSTMPKRKKKSDFILQYSYNGKKFIYIFIYYFKGKRLMQWLEFPL